MFQQLIIILPYFSELTRLFFSYLPNYEVSNFLHLVFMKHSSDGDVAANKFCKQQGIPDLPSSVEVWQLPVVGEAENSLEYLNELGKEVQAALNPFADADSKFQPKPRAPEDENSEQQPQTLVWPPPRPDLPKSNTVWPPPQNSNSTGYRGDPDAPELMRPDNVDITTFRPSSDAMKGDPTKNNENLPQPILLAKDALYGKLNEKSSKNSSKNPSPANSIISENKNENNRTENTIVCPSGTVKPEEEQIEGSETTQKAEVNESEQKLVKEEVMENEGQQNLQQKTKVQPKPIKLYPDLPSKPSYKNKSSHWYHHLSGKQRKYISYVVRGARKQGLIPSQVLSQEIGIALNDSEIFLNWYNEQPEEFNEEITNQGSDLYSDLMEPEVSSDFSSHQKNEALRSSIRSKVKEVQQKNEVPSSPGTYDPNVKLSTRINPSQHHKLPVFSYVNGLKEAEEFCVMNFDIPTDIKEATSRIKLPERNEDKNSYLEAIGRLGEYTAFQAFSSVHVDGKVSWVNEKGESGLPYDLLLEKDGEVTFVEVKSTPNAEQNTFLISDAEWTFAQSQGPKFCILRVSNCGKASVTIKLIPNPSLLWKTGALQVLLHCIGGAN